MPKLPAACGPYHGHPEGTETFHPIVLVIEQARTKTGRPSIIGPRGPHQSFALEAATAKKERLAALNASRHLAARSGRDPQELFGGRQGLKLKGVVLARSFADWISATWLKLNQNAGSHWRTIPGLEQAIVIKGPPRTWPTPTPTSEKPEVGAMFGVAVLVAEQGEGE